MFLGTNIAILMLVSMLGLEGIPANNGADLNLGSLLIFCVLFGASGSGFAALLRSQPPLDDRILARQKG